LNRQLSQQEIDAVFQNLEERKGTQKIVHKGVSSLLQPVEGDAGVDGTAD